MSKYKVDVNDTPEHVEQGSVSAEPADGAERAAPLESAVEEIPTKSGSEATGVIVTVGVVVVGAAVLEAALIPAILVGAAAALAPKYLPKLGDRLQPLFNSTVRGVYKLGRKARSAVGEAQERIHDIAAEIHAEETSGVAAAA